MAEISNADAGAPRATFYSIDQTPQGMPASAVTVQGNTLRMSLPAINGSFEGTLNADRTSIAGTFTQSGNALPLTLTRATPDTVWALPAPPKPMADAGAVFEVATIKPSDPSRPGWGIGINPSGLLNTINTTLADLIKFVLKEPIIPAGSNKGVFLLAVRSPLGWTGIVSPLLIGFLLRFVSGVPLLEKKHMNDPLYRPYAERTNAFFPWKPKR